MSSDTILQHQSLDIILWHNPATSILGHNSLTHSSNINPATSIMYLYSKDHYILQRFWDQHENWGIIKLKEIIYILVYIKLDFHYLTLTYILTIRLPDIRVYQEQNLALFTDLEQDHWLYLLTLKIIISHIIISLIKWPPGQFFTDHETDLCLIYWTWTRSQTYFIDLEQGHCLFLLTL